MQGKESLQELEDWLKIQKIRSKKRLWNLYVFLQEAYVFCALVFISTLILDFDSFFEAYTSWN